MEKATWTLAESKQAHAAFDAAYKRAMPSVAGGSRLVLIVRPETRTDAQNAMLHGLLSNIAKQARFNGEKLSIDDWKSLLVSGHTIATGGRVVAGLEGEPVMLRESTARMSKARLASLVDYIQAWMAMNNITEDQ